MSLAIWNKLSELERRIQALEAQIAHPMYEVSEGFEIVPEDRERLTKAGAVGAVRVRPATKSPEVWKLKHIGRGKYDVANTVSGLVHNDEALPKGEATALRDRLNA